MPIIYRPDFVGDAIANVLSNESIKDTLEHDKELAARKKRQKTTAVVAGAALGAIGGFALAPAAIASAGAGSGYAIGTGLTAAGTSALAGAVVPTLTGAALGGQIGGQLAAEDYVGALGTAAQTAKLGTEYVENQQIYGYQPTREGRATTAALAAKAGITIDRAAQIAQQRGVTVDQVLAEAQGAADDRAIENERYQSAAQVIGRQQGADALDYLNNDIEQFGGNQYAGEPDDGAYMEAQKQRSSIESDIASGNITRGEANQLAMPVRQLVGKAALGRRHREAPTLPRYDASGKQVGKMTPGLYEGDDGITTAITTNKDGTFDVKWKTGSPKLLAENVPPIITAAGPEAVKQYQREASHHALRARGVPENMLDKFFVGADGIPEQIKDDKTESDGMSYKDARAATAKEMEEVYPDTDIERAGMKKPIDPEELHRRTLKLMEQSKQVAQPPAAAPQSQAPSSMSPELDSISGELQTMMGNYGDYDQMPPEVQAQFDSLIQRAKAIGGR